MSGSPSTGSSKELTAIIVNLKEARVLEKSVQTLSLEESYASKLLDLNSKMVKFNYRRLKNNVGKIQSYLKPEEVSTMKSLEDEGRFRSIHPRICSSSSSTKIAAARRRLNLNSYRRAQSAMPRISQAQAEEQSIIEEEKPKKLSDKEAHFPCPKRLRPKTTTFCSSARESIDNTDNSPRKEQALPIPRSPAPPTPRSPRPKSTAFILERITRAQKANKMQAPQVIFSCHDEKPPEGATDAKGNKFVLDAFGPNPYEERRQKLLNRETETFQNLGQKKTGFVSDLNEFVEKNPCIVDVHPEMTQHIIGSIDSMASRSGMISEPGGRVGIRAGQSPLYKQFQELRKTRYLRINDSCIMPSTNTLAQEFHKKTEPWRQYNNNAKSFRASAQL